MQNGRIIVLFKKKSSKIMLTYNTMSAGEQVHPSIAVPNLRAVLSACSCPEFKLTFSRIT